MRLEEEAYSKLDREKQLAEKLRVGRWRHRYCCDLRRRRIR